MKRRLALDETGQITYCYASEENIGKGRCKHLEHQKDGESADDFIKRNDNIKALFPNYNHKHIDRSKIILPLKYLSVDENKILVPEDGFIHRNLMDYKVDGINDKYYNPKTKEFFKCDSHIKVDEFETFGIEGLKEDFISKVLQASNLDNCLKYHSFLMKDGDKWIAGTKSHDFKYSDECYEMSYQDILTIQKSKNDQIDKLNYDVGQNIEFDEMHKEIQTINNYTNKDFAEELFKLWSIDKLTMNDDRIHNTNNSGLLIEEKSNSIDLIPPFDFGMSYPESDITLFNEDVFKNDCIDFHEFVNFYLNTNKPLIKFNIPKLNNIIENYDNDVYTEEQVDNLMNLFINTLRLTQGILWEKE